MTVEEREVFMSKLGVDAVAMARVTWLTGSTQASGWTGAILGSTEIRPAAHVKLIAWKKGVVEPVWHEQGVRGCSTKEGITDLAGFANTPNMAPILKDATDRGYFALIDRYRQAQKSEDGSVGMTMSSLGSGSTCEYRK